MAATLNIQACRTSGVKVFADTESIADLQEVSDLVRATSLGVSLINQALVEMDEGDLPIMEEPEIFLPAFVDGLQDRPRKLRIKVGNGPRDAFLDVPQWFTEAIKKANPEYFADVDVSLEAETAVTLFSNHRWLDHWGWCGLYNSKDEFVEDLLISEPYGLSAKEIEEISSLCLKHGWEYNFVGKSAHYPSATLRIEIRPAKAAS